MEKRLGKGLGALIAEDVNKSNKKVATVRLKDIVPNPFQPRKRFDEEKMEDLIRSIKEKGVIQPILVRKKATGTGYELVAGERRWRAAQHLNIEEIPVIIRNDLDDANSLEISLIENIQREELNPVEEAVAYKELAEQFEYTLEKVGQMVGKDKTTISNSLRLLTLPEEIKKYLEEGKITTGHAKALLSLDSDRQRSKIVKIILQRGLSVRESENIVKTVGETKTKNRKTKDPEVSNIEEQMQHKLGTKVSIIQGKKRGRIEIQFFSNEDLQRLLRIMMG